MSRMPRLESERTFHDLQASRRARCLRGPDALRFADEEWLDHETWLRPALARLGEVAGRRVLDLGCGHGMAAVVLARRGAAVTALDLSGGYLAEARRRAEANAVAIQFVQADGQHLPFRSASFDCIWGNAVLHHLDLEVTGRELHRVLVPGGVAVFCEPWGENPLLAWARRRLPYPGKGRTADEEPLGRHDLEVLRQSFPDLQWEGFQLLAMLRRLMGPGRLSTMLERCDGGLLRWLPGLKRWCRYAVLTLRRS